MSRAKLHVLWSIKPGTSSGLTLIELLVTLAILSVLAAAALPYAELTIRRDRELELHRALREVRSAIDSFHDDWMAGRVSHGDDIASQDGYPKKLSVLVEGVDTGRAAGGKRRYLRRIPRDPFAEDAGKTPEEQWVKRGYQDEPNALSWNGEDVYDIRSGSSAQGLDGSTYRDW